MINRCRDSKTSFASYHSQLRFVDESLNLHFNRKALTFLLMFQSQKIFSSTRKQHKKEREKPWKIHVSLLRPRTPPIFRCSTKHFRIYWLLISFIYVTSAPWSKCGDGKGFYASDGRAPAENLTPNPLSKAKSGKHTKRAGVIELVVEAIKPHEALWNARSNYAGFRWFCTETDRGFGQSLIDFDVQRAGLVDFMERQLGFLSFRQRFSRFKVCVSFLGGQIPSFLQLFAFFSHLVRSPGKKGSLRVMRKRLMMRDEWWRQSRSSFLSSDAVEVSKARSVRFNCLRLGRGGRQTQRNGPATGAIFLAPTRAPN